MTTYNIELEGEILKVGFADPAQNDQIVRDAATRLDEMAESGELKEGSIHYLERGEDVSTRPMVRSLARVLVGLSSA